MEPGDKLNTPGDRLATDGPGTFNVTLALLVMTPCNSILGSSKKQLDVVMKAVASQRFFQSVIKFYIFLLFYFNCLSAIYQFVRISKKGFLC